MTQSEPTTLEPVQDSDPESQVADRQLPIARFVNEHPGMTIAGGIALGVLAAALLPKRSRKYVTEKSSAMADAVSAAGLMLYREAVDRAGAAGDGIRDIADRVGNAGDEKSEADAISDADEGPCQPSRFDLAAALAGILRQLRGR
ncbi:MAG: hypothetical protein P8J20_13065 [Novosphingobium sp.]|nr:hypothetical protein [Novosphingobium sp.]